MTREESEKLSEIVDQSIMKYAMMMNVSEAEVRAAFDNLIKPQSYVPLQGVYKNTEYYAAIRKGIRRFLQKKVRKHERRKWKSML